MNNSFDKYHFNNSFTPSHQFQNHPYFIKDQIEHTFDQRNHHQKIGIQKERHHHDSRTKDQVMTNINFSIEDLLSKISKATAQFQEPPKFTKPHSKPEYPAVFKLSNLSASTETTSNQQRSDPYIQRYQTHAENTRKSEPRAQTANHDKNTKDVFGQKQNSLYQTLPSPTNQMRNQLRSETYNHSKNTSQKYQDSKQNFDYISEYKLETTPFEWGRNSSRNQTQPQNVTEWGRNSSRNQPFQETQQRFHQIKQNTLQKVNNNKWENIHETKNDTVHNYLHSQLSHHNWGINSTKNLEAYNYGDKHEKNLAKESNDFGNHTEKTENKIEDFETTWRKYQIKMNELKNNSKTERYQNFQFKNIEKQDHDFSQMKIDLITPQRKQFISQPQIQINNEHSDKWSHSATTSPKKEIKGLFNTIQTSAFGHVSNNPIRNKQYKKSIIILDDENIPSSYLPVPGSEDMKVNSLFDGKRIREVAASTIIESPDKEKRLKMQNPFNQILKTNTNETHQNERFQNQQQNLYEPLDNVPLIKINTVQKSEIIHSIDFGPKMTIQDFHLGKQLGSGKFGDVYQAVHKATGALFAIKKIFKSTILEYNMIEQFTRELKIHYSLNYPNIIKLYTHFDDEYHVFLVMEYGEGGMLMEKVKSGEKFSSIIVEQMLRAVEYLHNKKIAHRDIKPQNIVLMFGDTAKLCDFGWSRVFDSDMKKTFCGTLDYVSPQMKDKGEYSLKIDVWSLGVLTFELICGFAPFKDEITNWKKKGGNMNKAWNWNILYPPEISSVSQSFMRNLLKQNPEQRANIRFCLNHLFIRKYNQMSFNNEEEKVFREVSMVLKED